MKKQTNVRPISANFNTLFKKIHTDNILRGQHCKTLKKDHSIISENEKSDFLYSIFRTGSAVDPDKRLFKRIREQNRLGNKSTKNESQTEQLKTFKSHLKKIQQQITNKLQQKSPQQLHPLNTQLHKISSLCKKTKQSPQTTPDILKQFQGKISQQLTYRESRIIFYLIYMKILEFEEKQKLQNLKKQLQLLYLCDQYSRLLEYYWLTLYVCYRVQKILFLFKMYEQSKVYLWRALRIAIFLKSQDQEFRALEMLKLMEYYEGNLIDSSQQYLEKNQKQLIQKNFHPLHDLSNQPQILRPYLGRMKSQENDDIKNNVENFSKNMVFMRKHFTQRSHKIGQTVKKVNKVGYISKYLQDGTVVQIAPHPQYLPTNHKRQILITQFKINTNSSQSINKMVKNSSTSRIGNKNWQANSNMWVNAKDKLEGNKKLYRIYLQLFIQMLEDILREVK